jgi:hypothetical protein
VFSCCLGRILTFERAGRRHALLKLTARVAALRPGGSTDAAAGFQLRSGRTATILAYQSTEQPQVTDPGHDESKKPRKL